MSDIGSRQYVSITPIPVEATSPGDKFHYNQYFYRITNLHDKKLPEEVGLHCLWIACRFKHGNQEVEASGMTLVMLDGEPSLDSNILAGMIFAREEVVLDEANEETIEENEVYRLKVSQNLNATFEDLPDREDQ